jgi:hypothetical protein
MIAEHILKFFGTNFIIFSSHYFDFKNCKNLGNKYNAHIIFSTFFSSSDTSNIILETFPL